MLLALPFGKSHRLYKFELGVVLLLCRSIKETGQRALSLNDSAVVTNFYVTLFMLLQSLPILQT